MAAPALATDIVGRDEELAVVREFLAATERLPSALMIEGEAGIGKTTLWNAGLTAASEFGYRVLSARPAQAESQISYAGLADLLAPVLERVLDELPPPQRRALEIAMLLRDAEDGVPDQGAIAFALLGTLRAAAADAPLLIAIDDLQWLDAPSAFALRFAVRRLRADAVGLFVSVRRDGDSQVSLADLLPDKRIRQIHVGALSLGALNHLIQARVDLVLPRPAIKRLHETSAGNPFFALELARALKERGGEPKPGEPLPVSGELRQLLRRRLAVLPQKTQRALLVAASVPRPRVALVAGATGEAARESLLRAAEAGIVELDGDEIRFIHPLFASAVYLEADANDRQTVHRNLAVIADDPEERAWHLAFSADERDAEVASALDEAAQIARARGAPQASAEFRERACHLTPENEPDAAQRRRLEAGTAYFEAGNIVRARAVLREAVETAHVGPQRAAALVRLAQVHHYAGDQRIAVDLFRESLADAAEDSAVRADAAEGLANSLFFLREDLAEALNHARFAAEIARRDGDRGQLAVALGTQGMIEAVLGRHDAEVTLQSALTLENYVRDVPFLRFPSFQLAVSRVWGDEVAAARETLQRIEESEIARGNETSLPFVLAYRSLAEFLSGRWQEALRAAEAGADVARTAGQEIGLAFALSTRALAASGLGREREVRANASEALALAEQGSLFAASTSLWALALLELSLERPAEAHEHLASLVARVERAEIGEPGSIRFVTDDVEALVALGEQDAAVALLNRFEENARRLGRRSVLAATHRCRGLLAVGSGNDVDAFAAFAQALDERVSLQLPFERARTLLALGSAQRHARLRRAARETLEEAQRVFERLGAALWAERAGKELRRISGRAPSPDRLTAAETRVAELVAIGRTNRQVAEALHITQRTVEGTLSRVYTKLGVRSRSELAHRWTARN
jgi:DNA-binding CsgD family transcriptional regulator